MRESSSFDFITIVSELRELVGSKVEKVYNPFKKEFLFVLYHPEQGKKHLRIIVPEVMYVTEKLFENPTYPSHFCMFLRKHLNGGVISKLVQKGLERVVEIHFVTRGKQYVLVMEFFSKGNMILCDDDYQIISPLNVEDWPNRSIRPKRKYLFPPSNNVVDENSLSSVLSLSRKKDLVRALAVDAGTGGKYAEEICARSGVDKSTPPQDLSNHELNQVVKTFFGIIKKLKTNPEPNIVVKNGKNHDVVPLTMKVYEGLEKKFYSSFNKALDDFYVRQRKKELKETVKEAKEDNVERLEQVLRTQLEQRKEFERKSEELFEKGEALKNNFSIVERIVNALLGARKQGYSWEEIRTRLDLEKDGGNYEAGIVESINPDEGVMVLELDGNRIDFDFTQEVSDVMEELFEKAKKFESKGEGAEKALKNTRQRIVEAKAKQVKPDISIRHKGRGEEKKVEEMWYEEYRWFYTTNGFLCLSGRSAGQNESLIKKHLEVNDKVLHADVFGSPFTIVKNGREAEDEDLRQAAKQTASYSSAWKNNRSVDVYAVKPEQVTKQAPSGEYVSRGAFMIKGKKKYFENILPELCVGYGKGKVLAGPPSAVRGQAKHYLVIVPGSTPKSEAAKEVKEYLEGKGHEPSMERIQRALPAGGVRIKKRYGQ